MWGKLQAASDLSPTCTLSQLLYRISGPAPIPPSDKTWQDLFVQHYETLVHLDPMNNTVVETICHAMGRNAIVSGNLAALTVHVSRMVSDLTKSSSLKILSGGSDAATSVITATSATTTTDQLHQETHAHEKQYPSNHFSQHNHHPPIIMDGIIVKNSKTTRPDTVVELKKTKTKNKKKDLLALVGKARATCGVLNLLRILAHAVVTASCNNNNDDNESVSSSCKFLNAAFSTAVKKWEAPTSNTNSCYNIATKQGQEGSAISSNVYRNHHVHGRGDVATELLSSLLIFISSQHYPQPEVYDATVLALSLLLVLLSTQLYQPMISSRQRYFEGSEQHNQTLYSNYFLDKLMYYVARQKGLNMDGTAHKVVGAILQWTVMRPRPPPQSIAAHHLSIVQSLVNSRGEKTDIDGMYDNHAIVPSDIAPHTIGGNGKHSDDINSQSTGRGSSRSTLTSSTEIRRYSQQHRSQEGIPSLNFLTSSTATGRILVQVTIGVLAGTILLPFRLVRLAAATMGLTFGNDKRDLKTKLLHGVTTNDVIWLGRSPLADLGGCLLLLLNHNHRAAEDFVDTVTNNVDNNGIVAESPIPNMFRMELASLSDNRWDSRNADESTGPIICIEHGLEPWVGENYDTNGTLERDAFIRQADDEHYPVSKTSGHQHLMVNFESLFEALGVIVHTEMGCLILYTLLQTCSSFSAAVSARSDLDTLVVPLLRTLYGASKGQIRTRAPMSSSDASVGSGSSDEKSTLIGNAESQLPMTPSNLESRPFRSQSHLYVILILLLLFSQDSSFGSDAFRRVNLVHIAWYKERSLRDVSLGSLLVLVLLRCMTFNLNRLQDAFLLSNCCAVLLNLAPHVEHLHSYASMRLASVTASCMKKFVSLASTGEISEESRYDITSIAGMYGEASRALLQVVQQALRRKVVARNLHLLYALVYLQADLDSAIDSGMFTLREIGDVSSIIKQADSIVRKDEVTLTAIHAMSILKQEFRSLDGRSGTRPANNVDDGHRARVDSIDSTTTSSSEAGLYDADFSFTYEEEADPEVFFLPYVWEVAVCVVTASLLEWNKQSIRVFPIVDSSSTCGDLYSSETAKIHDRNVYSNDVTDVV